MKEKFRIYKICWNTHGDQVDLPEEVIVDDLGKEVVDKIFDSEDDEGGAIISNILIDRYGYSIESCGFGRVK